VYWATICPMIYINRDGYHISFEVLNTSAIAIMSIPESLQAVISTQAEDGIFISYNPALMRTQKKYIY
jgi:hypothetical protein